MNQDFTRLYQLIDYRFNTSSLIKTAFTHRSASRENNERLEFLGDAVLSFIIASFLYQKLPQADEGLLSRYRASLVRENTLAGIARSLQLGDYLELGSGEFKTGGRQRDSILADVFEALLGAVYLDGGFEACHRIVFHLFSSEITRLTDEKELKDPKSLLQECLQARKLPVPEYVLVEVSGDPHARHFIVECKSSLLKNNARGEGSSRRRAEQQAAQLALQEIESSQ